MRVRMILAALFVAAVVAAGAQLSIHAPAAPDVSHAAGAAAPGESGADADPAARWSAPPQLHALLFDSGWHAAAAHALVSGPRHFLVIVPRPAHGPPHGAIHAPPHLRHVPLLI